MTTKKARKRKGALRAFLRDIPASCYDLERYRAIRTSPLGASVRYFIAFAVLITLVMAAGIIPGTARTLSSFRTDVLGPLPDEATFTMEDGRFSTTLETPYVQDLEGMGIRIDPSVEGTEVDVQRTPEIVVGHDALFLIEQDNTIQTYLFKGNEDVSLSAGEVKDWMRDNTPFIIAATVGAFALAYGLAAAFGTVFFVVIAAALAMLLSRAWGNRMRYTSWLAVGLHAVTLPLLVDMFFDSVLHPLPYLFAVIFTMFMVAVAVDERANPTVGTEQ